MSKGKWVWIELKKGNWDLWWIPFGRWTENPFFIMVLWQAQTNANRVA